jgi:hypothetical protein
MELSTALLVYLAVVIFTAIIVHRVNVKPRSAVILGLILGQIILNLLVPPTNLNPMNDTAQAFTSSSAIYLVIQLVTPIVVLIFCVFMSMYDHQLNDKVEIAKV